MPLCLCVCLRVLAMAKRSAEWCSFRGNKFCLGDAGGAEMKCLTVTGCLWNPAGLWLAVADRPAYDWLRLVQSQSCQPAANFSSSVICVHLLLYNTTISLLHLNFVKLRSGIFTDGILIPHFPFDVICQVKFKVNSAPWTRLCTDKNFMHFSYFLGFLFCLSIWMTSHERIDIIVFTVYCSCAYIIENFYSMIECDADFQNW